MSAARPTSYISEELQIRYLQTVKLILQADQDLLEGISEQNKKHFEKLRNQVKEALQNKKRENDEFSLGLDMAAVRKEQAVKAFLAAHKEERRRNFDLDKAHFEAGEQQKRMMAESFKPLPISALNINPAPVIQDKSKKVAVEDNFYRLATAVISPWQIAVEAAAENFIQEILVRFNDSLREAFSTLSNEKRAEFIEDHTMLISNFRKELLLPTPDEMIEMIPGFKDAFTEECEDINDQSEAKRALDAIVNPIYQLSAKAAFMKYAASLDGLFNKHGMTLKTSISHDDINVLTSDYAASLTNAYYPQANLQAEIQHLASDPSKTPLAPKPSFGRNRSHEDDEEEQTLTSSITKTR